MTPDDPGHAAARRPVLRIISGDATPEEIAAILAIVAARSGPAQDEPDDDVAAAWSRGFAHRSARARPPVGWEAEPQATRWRTSYWPR